MALIRICESDDWFVDYDKERGMYRVSYFEDNHFKDECWFDEYKGCSGCVYEDADGSTVDISNCVGCSRNSELAKNDYYKRK